MEFITFRCSSCNHGMKVGLDKAGRKAKCPKCQTELTIPKSEPAPAPAPVPDKPPEEDDEYKIGGSYGVLIDKDEEEKKRLAAELEKAKKKEKKKPAPRLEIKKKELKDKKKWLQVRRSLPIFLTAVGVWGGALLFPVLVVVIGLFASSDYTAIAELALLDELPAPPPPGFVQGLDPIKFSLGLIAGGDQTGLARTLHIIGLILALAAGGLFLTGYFMAMAVPDRFGTKGQVKTLMILGVINLVMVLGFKLLPMMGLFNGWIPLLTPEVAMQEGNIGRALPVQVFWSFSGFVVELLTQIILLVQYLEPILLGVFIWTVGISMKEVDLEEAGLGLAKMGFGVFFILLSYHVVSCCGTSNVLVMLLRVLYVLWIGFTAGWIYKFIMVLLLTRDTFDKRIFGVAYADELDKDDEEEDEDEKDDEDED